MSQIQWEQLKPGIESLIAEEGLPAEFLDTVFAYYLPLAQQIMERQRALGRPMIVGINGAQGTGKSTLALFLQKILTHHLNCPCAGFSLDDIYLTRAERQHLGATVHPLFVTRGVPGTHDLGLGQATVDALCRAVSGTTVPIPGFDKSQDDRSATSAWKHHEGVAKVILLEGWCMAARPVTDGAQLLQPMNELERSEDAEGLWRSYVNQQLAGAYNDFFSQLDFLIMLKAPSMECIVEWRTLQEQKLAEKIGSHHNGANVSGIMSPSQIKRFVMHYERLTRAMLDTMPSHADVVLVIDEAHRIAEVLKHDQ